MSLATLDPDLNTTVACPDITITDDTVYDAILGPELVVNGGFSSGSSWTLDTGWVISGGVATHTSGISSNMVQSIAGVVADTSYLVSFTITNYVSTGVEAILYIGGFGSDAFVSVTANGSYSTTVTTGSTVPASIINFLTDKALTVDNISIKTSTPYTRSISVKNPDGSYADLGTNNTYTFLLTVSTFINNSQEGEVFTFTACDESVTYTVPTINSANDFTCMMQDIVDLLASTTVGEFPNYTESLSSNTITIKFSEPGIPVPFLVRYSAGNSTTYYTLSQTVSASQSLGLSNSGDNDIVLTPSDHGGKYTIKLSIWSDDPCDRRTQVIYLWNWCYDYKLLNECFVDLVKEQECDCGPCKEEACNKATKLRNLIQAAQLTELYTGSGPDVQTIIDSALAICDDDCGCEGC